MSTTEQSATQANAKLAKVYAYISFLGVLTGVLAAHVPFLIGHPWTSCDNASSPLTCVLIYHLYEVPLVVYLIYVAWYAVKRFSGSTLQQFRSLVLFGVVVNVAFFTFETTLILDGLQRGAFQWEILLISCVAAILAGGAGFGIYVHQKLGK